MLFSGKKVLCLGTGLGSCFRSLGFSCFRSRFCVCIHDFRFCLIIQGEIDHIFVGIGFAFVVFLIILIFADFCDLRVIQQEFLNLFRRSSSMTLSLEYVDSNSSTLLMP